MNCSVAIIFIASHNRWKFLIRCLTLEKSFYEWLSKLMPEGMKGKSFIERGTTPMEERYIGNAKMFSEAEKRKILHVYKDGLNYTNITKALLSRKPRI